MTPSDGGRGIKAMWQQLTKLERALSVMLIATAFTWGIFKKIDAQTTLPARVKAVEDSLPHINSSFDSLRGHQKDADVHQARIEDKLDRAICFLEENKRPTGRSCL